MALAIIILNCLQNIDLTHITARERVLHLAGNNTKLVIQ